MKEFLLKIQICLCKKRSITRFTPKSEDKYSGRYVNSTYIDIMVISFSSIKVSLRKFTKKNYDPGRIL